jgi:transposase
MSTKKKRPPAPSSMLVTEAREGIVVGVDPHKHSLTAVVLDARGGLLGAEHFKVSGPGHRALEAWAGSLGTVIRWGVENAGGWGRHTAIYLAGAGHDVRDVCPNRTGRQDRARMRGKSDSLDAERVARETLAHPLLPRAFKAAEQQAAPDEHRELLTLWHNKRRSLIKSRQHLLNEAEFLLNDLPLPVLEQLPDTKAVRPRLAALAGRRGANAPTRLRLQLLREHQREIARLDAAERRVTDQLAELVAAGRSSLSEHCGLCTRSTAELLVEVGDPRRFTQAGFARFNGSAPLVASTAEGPGEPTRHRLNPGGNRRVNAILHRMAVTQLRCDPRAQALYANARARGHSKREARRVLKRHLSNIIHRTMMRDLSTSPLT